MRVMFSLKVISYIFGAIAMPLNFTHAAVIVFKGEMLRDPRESWDWIRRAIKLFRHILIFIGMLNLVISFKFISRGSCRELKHVFSVYPTPYTS